MTVRISRGGHSSGGTVRRCRQPGKPLRLTFMIEDCEAAGDFPETREVTHTRFSRLTIGLLHLLWS